MGVKFPSWREKVDQKKLIIAKRPLARGVQQEERPAMQKTFLKFIVFELVERVARFRLLLNECADSLHESAPVLLCSLKEAADRLETELLSQKSALNRLFTESTAKSGTQGHEGMIAALYTQLKTLSGLLCKLRELPLAPETFLFLKEVLPPDLLKSVGEQSIFLCAEGEQLEAVPGLPNILIDGLSVLQKNNPLAWLPLTQSYSGFLTQHASSLAAIKVELTKPGPKKASEAIPEAIAEPLIQHAVNLRLLGPAYYFHSLVDAYFQQDEAFLQVVEPALFFGLNHQNFIHKSLVILHEACERSKPAAGMAFAPLTDETLANLFRAVEKAVPAKFAFQEKNLQRALQLQERLEQGVLMSSTGLYPVQEVADNLNSTRDQADFSIYGPLSMLTEYPHSAKEIITAGWLHKMERGPVWLYSILNEDRPEGFDKVLTLLDYQDHLLRKSIETSEIHRVLLCSQ